MLVVRRIITVLLGLVPLLLLAAGIAGVVGDVRPRDPSWYSIRDETALSDAVMYAAVWGVGLFGCHRL